MQGGPGGFGSTSNNGDWRRAGRSCRQAGAAGTDLADGVYVQAGTIKVLDSIFASNPNSSGGIDVAGAFTSLGHNLIGNGDGSSGFVNGTSGDLVRAPPPIRSIRNWEA